MILELMDQYDPNTVKIDFSTGEYSVMDIDYNIPIIHYNKYHKSHTNEVKEGNKTILLTHNFFYGVLIDIGEQPRDKDIKRMELLKYEQKIKELKKEIEGF